MRLRFGLVLVFALAACAERRDQPAHAQVACVARLQFSTPAARGEFLEANAATVFQHAAANEMFVLSSADRLNVSVFTQVPSCAGLSLDTRYGLDSADAHLIDAQELPVDAVVQQLTQAGSADETTVRACVVTFPADADQVGRMMAAFPYVGLRETVIAGADGAIYIGAAEHCDLASGLASIAFRQLNSGALQGPRACSNASFLECGHPD